MIESIEAEIKVIEPVMVPPFNLGSIDVRDGATHFEYDLRVKSFDFSGEKPREIIFSWAGPLDRVDAVEGYIASMTPRRVEIVVTVGHQSIQDQRTEQEKEANSLNNIRINTLYSKRQFDSVSDFIEAVKQIAEGQR